MRAFRFNEVTVERTRANGISDLLSLELDLTEDETETVEFLLRPEVSGRLDTKDLIHALNQVVKDQSAEHFGDNLVFATSPKTVNDVFLRYLNLADLGVTKSPPVNIKTWITGSELGFRRTAEALLEAERHPGVEVSSLEMWHCLAETNEGERRLLTRFHIPAEVGVQRWAAFWCFAVTQGLLRTKRGGHYWRQLDARFIAPGSHSRPGGNIDSFKDGASRYRNSEDGKRAELRAKSLIERTRILPLDSQRTSPVPRKNRHPLRDIVFHKFQQRVMLEGLKQLRDDVPPNLISTVVLSPRSYRQWRKASLLHRLSAVGIDELKQQQVVTFLAERESLAPLILGLINESCRFIEDNADGREVWLLNANSCESDKPDRWLMIAYLTLPFHRRFSRFRHPSGRNDLVPEEAVKWLIRQFRPETERNA